MNNLKSITVIYDDRSGCEGWFARATVEISDDTQDRDIPLDCDPATDDEELADEARSEVRMDALLKCHVAENFPVTVAKSLTAAALEHTEVTP